MRLGDAAFCSEKVVQKDAAFFVWYKGLVVLNDQNEIELGFEGFDFEWILYKGSGPNSSLMFKVQTFAGKASPLTFEMIVTWPRMPTRGSGPKSEVVPLSFALSHLHLEVGWIFSSFRACLIFWAQKILYFLDSRNSERKKHYSSGPYLKTFRKPTPLTPWAPSFLWRASPL